MKLTLTRRLILTMSMKFKSRRGLTLIINCVGSFLCIVIIPKGFLSVQSSSDVVKEDVDKPMPIQSFEYREILWTSNSNSVTESLGSSSVGESQNIPPEVKNILNGLKNVHAKSKGSFIKVNNNNSKPMTSQPATASPYDKASVSSDKSGLSFLKTLKELPWKELDSDDNDKASEFEEMLVHKVTSFLVMGPKVPVKQQCSAPPLTPRKELNCDKVYKVRKVGVLLQLDFAVDALEIHMNELDDLVDKFFILESTYFYSTKSAIKKPLIWEMIKHEPRFKKFSRKVVFFVVDDSELELEQMNYKANRANSKDTNNAITGAGTLAKKQEKLLWEKFINWNNSTRFFDDHDLLGFGKATEIPNRRAINYLKNCVLPSDAVDIGIWLPHGSIDKLAKSDFPVYEHPYTLGNPTYWTLKAAKVQSSLSVPSRMFGKSKAFLLGGMEMANYAYLPYQLLSTILQSDSEFNLKKFISKINFGEEDELLVESQFIDGMMNDYLNPEERKDTKRIVKVKEFERIDKEEADEIIYFPWFYECNRKRYPAWRRKHDRRLDGNLKF